MVNSWPLTAWFEAGASPATLDAATLAVQRTSCNPLRVSALKMVALSGEFGTVEGVVMVRRNVEAAVCIGPPVVVSCRPMFVVLVVW